jgi:hypothetical protein
MSHAIYSLPVECVFPFGCADISREARSSLGVGTLGGHLHCSHRCAVISPGAALIVDDVGDFGVAQCAGKRWHGSSVDDTSGPAALHTIEDHLNVFCGIVFIDDAASLERRKYTGQTFAIGLMASGTVGDV